MLSKVPGKRQFESRDIGDDKRRVHLEYRKRYFPEFTHAIERWQVSEIEPENVFPVKALIIQGSADVGSETMDLLGKVVFFIGVQVHL